MALETFLTVTLEKRRGKERGASEPGFSRQMERGFSGCSLEFGKGRWRLNGSFLPPSRGKDVDQTQAVRIHQLLLHHPPETEEAPASHGLLYFRYLVAWVNPSQPRTEVTPFPSRVTLSRRFRFTMRPNGWLFPSLKLVIRDITQNPKG